MTPAAHEKVADSALEPGTRLGHPLEECEPVGEDQFRRGTGGRGAEIGDKIGDGEIDLVPDGGDDGETRGGDGAGDNLLIESP